MIEVCQYTAFLFICLLFSQLCAIRKLIVSNMIYEQVIGNGKFERITGSHLGGGTILGLARLLTGCSRYYSIRV
jgi:pantothenate kinase